MITMLGKSNYRFVWAVFFVAGLAVTPLANAQNKWDLQEKVKMAEEGNKWAAYELWDAYHRGKHGVECDPAQANRWLGEFVQNVWVVRFEPVGSFAPATPREFLQTINRHATTRSGQTGIGQASFFRTTKQGNKLVGSFLSTEPDQLKAALAKVPDLKVTSAEKISSEEFVRYEQTKQESLTNSAGDKWDLELKRKLAEGGNKWAAYELWDAYHRGKHGVQPDPSQADKWLKEFIQKVWVVRFEPAGEFAPATPGEFLQTINRHASTRSGETDIGQASFFRTTNQNGKLVGSFLSNEPDQLKAALGKVPGLKVTSVEPITPEDFIQYEKSRQESL